MTAPPFGLTVKRKSPKEPRSPKKRKEKMDQTNGVPAADSDGGSGSFLVTAVEKGTRWTKEERELFLQHLKDCRIGRDRYDMKKMASYFPNRTNSQCTKRLQNFKLQRKREEEKDKRQREQQQQQQQATQRGRKRKQQPSAPALRPSEPPTYHQPRQNEIQKGQDERQQERHGQEEQQQGVEQKSTDCDEQPIKNRVETEESVESVGTGDDVDGGNTNNSYNRDHHQQQQQQQRTNQNGSNENTKPVASGDDDDDDDDEGVDDNGDSGVGGRDEALESRGETNVDTAASGSTRTTSSTETAQPTSPPLTTTTTTTVDEETNTEPTRGSGTERVASSTASSPSTSSATTTTTTTTPATAATEAAMAATILANLDPNSNRTACVRTCTQSDKLQDGEITYVGTVTESTGMAVIPPKFDGADKKYRPVFDQIQEQLSRREVFDKLSHWTKDDSVSIIQGGRVEIFVTTIGKKKSTAFDEIILSSFSGRTKKRAAKKLFLEYARKQAQRDPRLKGKRFKFSQYSIIYSYTKSSPQVPHIDVAKSGMFQFGLTLTPSSDSTLIFDEDNGIKNIDTMEDVIGRFHDVGEQNGFKLTNGFVDALRRERIDPLSEVKKLVSTGNGNALYTRCSSEFMSTKMQQAKNLPVGAATSLPAGIPHSGPRSEQPRAVLFFTGTEGKDVYDVETQICSVRFLLITIWKLWHKHHIGQPERLLLLQLLDFYMSGCEYYRKLHTLCDFVFPKTMDTSLFKEFMCIVQYGPHDSETSRYQYIVRSSMNSQLLPRVSVSYDSNAYHDFEYAVDCQEGDEYLLSPDGTCRKVLKTILHRLADHRCIFEVQEHGKTVQYGAEAGDNFLIAMKPGQENIYFDGTNAIEFRVTAERFGGWLVQLGSVKIPIRMS